MWEWISNGKTCKNKEKVRYEEEAYEFRRMFAEDSVLRIGKGILERYN